MSGQIHSPGDPHPHHVSLSRALPCQLPHRAPGSPASVKPICHQAAPSPSPPAPAQQQTLSQRHQPLHLSSSASILPSWGKLRHHLNKKPQSPYRWSACHFHGRCPGQHQNCSEKHCPPDGKEGGENGSGTKQGTATSTFAREGFHEALSCGSSWEGTDWAAGASEATDTGVPCGREVRKHSHQRNQGPLMNAVTRRALTLLGMVFACLVVWLSASQALIYAEPPGDLVKMQLLI